MDETMESVVGQLCDIIEGDGEFLPNGRALALLDARSADDEIERLEEKIEEIEWCADDYYQIDKDDLDMIVTRAMGKMFFAKDGTYMETEEFDFDNFVDDTIAELEKEMDKVNKNKDL